MISLPVVCCFNTQPPKGGWRLQTERVLDMLVSTHSRLKAAGKIGRHLYLLIALFQHTAA